MSRANNLVSCTSATTFTWIMSSSVCKSDSWKKPYIAEAGVVDQHVDLDAGRAHLVVNRAGARGSPRSATTTRTVTPCRPSISFLRRSAGRRCAR